jgi:hypothetical protein
MIFNWSRDKDPKFKYLNDVHERSFIKNQDIDNLWNSYLNNFDDNSCLKSQKISEHPLISIIKEDSNIYATDSSILTEFTNTPFSYDGLINFAKKYGRLGIESHFDNPETYLELANTWLWELANVNNVLSLINLKQDLNVEKFSQYLKIDKQTGLWEYENNHYTLGDLKFPIYVFPTGNFEIGFNKELTRFTEDLNEKNLPLVIDDILSIIFYNFYRERMKPVISTKNGTFSSEVQPTSLIGFIWFELFRIVENNNIIRKCSYCKNSFFVGQGNARIDKKYCSNSCIVNGSRTETILKKNKNDFTNKGYTIIQSQSTSPSSFDYWLFDENKKLIAGLDIVQSEVSEKSQKWDNQSLSIGKRLIDTKLEFAFLINKNNQKFLFKKNGYVFANPIKFIPQISDLKKALEEMSKYLEKKYYLSDEQKENEQALMQLKIDEILILEDKDKKETA